MGCKMRIVFIFLAFLLAFPFTGIGQEAIMPDPAKLPPYLADRGTGTPSSMFGTYIRDNELIIYPFVEYFFNSTEEYNPEDLGFDEDEDFTGSSRGIEYLIFIGYGLHEDVQIEFEAAVFTQQSLLKDSDDTSDLDNELTESGLGDVQTLIAWSWLRETADHPEFFSFLEIVFPTQNDNVLIGTPDYEYKLGTGIINGFSWGTVTFRLAVEYEAEDAEGGFGEYAVEYLKRLSPRWRIYGSIEGDDEDAELITEVQWHFSETALFKFNNAFGLTPGAEDWAPEYGIMMSF